MGRLTRPRQTRGSSAKHGRILQDHFRPNQGGLRVRRANQARLKVIAQPSTQTLVDSACYVVPVIVDYPAREHNRPGLEHQGKFAQESAEPVPVVLTTFIA